MAVKEKEKPEEGMTRRDFVKNLGKKAAIVGAAATLPAVLEACGPKSATGHYTEDGLIIDLMGTIVPGSIKFETTRGDKVAGGLFSADVAGIERSTLNFKLASPYFEGERVIGVLNPNGTYEDGLRALNEVIKDGDTIALISFMSGKIISEKNNPQMIYLEQIRVNPEIK
ncbi:MAG: twin-arginine translocation signal domain-containing protein [Candidatus Altiarchaeota archaeon]